MSAFGKVLLSPLGALMGVFDKPKKQTPVTPAQVTPRANSVALDALAARRGSAVNQRTGSGGMESSTGKKTLLGQ